ncbi:MAG: T9SS type A sorting domain-containing protein [Candidatus Edwardsbacteria bacterium]|nr:T9SS type A sorting domain-containing protein [Candidatus Edwardsbacteria bacterium]MBU1576882.1 T9SS type A sorting domain-containing protein [Candidatus Edwardsbacteria bacterium]MBU2463163.1 T9SS type A sorting domain-containing protein [Candidatus Edwardsbacteria bacterium]MBU2593462.1 T9SS type A sorting domain-containing protein [Candidatus Edwardsbacteria bacterium]
MRKYIFLTAAIIMTAIAANAAAPSITLTTLWPDTSFTGPYTVRTVIKCPEGVNYPMLGFYFNPDGFGGDPYQWPYVWNDPSDNWIEEYTQVGDTFYFDIPTVPIGLETPVEVGYLVYAENAGTAEYVYDPGWDTCYSFINKVYSPAYSNVSVLRDTFYTGPFIVRTNLTTAYGDTVNNDILNSDIVGGPDCIRDSVGADGFYYYIMPRHGGASLTPITVNWFMMAYDTMGNWGQYPTKRDTTNHFRIIDPWSYNTKLIANTDQLGPFPVWTSFKSEGSIANDSLWIYQSGWVPYPRDSMVGGVYYYTIPAQSLPVVNPVSVTWHIKAGDDLTGNYSYQPVTAPLTNNEFRIFDWTPPQVSNTTAWKDTSYTGPFPVYTQVSDTSGISQVRLYYRVKPFTSADTSWSYLPMSLTGSPNEYQGSIPPQYPGTMVQYYVSGRDGALDQAGQPIWNTGYYPAGGSLTPWHFFVGEHKHKILLVNDALPANAYGQYYLTSMDTTGVLYGYWDNRKANVLSVLGNFDVLVWFTGDDSLTTLTQTERDSLSAFLDRGGNLLLSSKNLGQNVSDTATFYNSYLKADFDVSNVAAANINSIGQVALPISHGIADSLYIYTGGTAGNWRSIDRMFPLAGAESVFQFRTIGGSSVIRCSTAVYKTVFASIPLEAVATISAGKLSRTEFIARSLRWFGIPAFYKVEGEPEALVYGKTTILNQARPNPFTSNTSISYALPTASRVALKVYNIVGQEIATLCDGEQAAGMHEVSWNGRDNSGRKVSNGVYLYRLTTGNQSLTKKMVKVR